MNDGLNPRQRKEVASIVRAMLDDVIVDRLTNEKHGEPVPMKAQEVRAENARAAVRAGETPAPEWDDDE